MRFISAPMASTVSRAGRSSRAICRFTRPWKHCSGTNSDCWCPFALLIAMQMSRSAVVSNGSTLRMVVPNNVSRMYDTRAPPRNSSPDEADEDEEE